VRSVQSKPDGPAGAARFTGFVLVGALYVFAPAVGCSEDARECAPEPALILGGFVLGGWLVGIALAFAVRRAWAFGQSRSRSSDSQGVR